MNRTTTAVTAAISLLVGLCVPSFASLGRPPTPAAETENGVTYLTGGVGSVERDTVEAMAKDYTLKLVFSEDRGAYLGDVDVVIESSSGKRLLHARSDGPWFFAKLGDGDYRVIVTDFGKSYERDLKVVSGRQTSSYFSWPATS